MYRSTIIHLPHINQLLPPRTRNLIRERLVRQRLPGGFDDVHLVAGPRRLGGQILQAGGAGELEDEMLDAETEAWGTLAWFRALSRVGKTYLADD